jgi:hypothetical protein
MQSFLPKKSYKFLYLLLIADLMFIIFHIGHLMTTDKVGLAAQNNSPFALGKDLGLAESFMYVKEYWTVLLFLILAFQKRKFIYLGWSSLFLFIMYDDIFQLHEHAGYTISAWMEFLPVSFLRANDLGELVFYIVVGVIFILLLVVPYLVADRETRQLSNQFLFLLGILGFCGVVLDLFQLKFIQQKVFFDIVGVLEDGGELVVISLICWYAYVLSGWKEKKNPIDVL